MTLSASGRVAGDEAASSPVPPNSPIVSDYLPVRTMPVLDDHFAIADGHEQDTLLAIERFANARRNKVQYLSRPPSPETLLASTHRRYER